MDVWTETKISFAFRRIIYNTYRALRNIYISVNLRYCLTSVNIDF